MVYFDLPDLSLTRFWHYYSTEKYSSVFSRYGRVGLWV